MKRSLIGGAFGALFGYFLGNYVYDFYSKSHPQATSTELGLVGIVTLFSVLGFGYLGFKIGKSTEE